ncbi:MAG: diadenylate cyclase CdaA [Oscillospiraceae bacterium]|nr:diadenylate cyclase CdaA [Oscillospiraceae bacterium]
MDKIIDFFKDVFSMLPTLKIMDVVDILLVAVVIYAVFMMIRTTGSARIAKSVIIILLLTGVTELLNMHLTNFILDGILEIGLIALVIMFQPELRRMLEKMGSKSFREILNMKTEQRDVEKVIEQTVAACEILSKEHTGALIVFERDVSLMDYQKTGTVVDAQVSHELLRNIFFTKAALHDGAVLVRKERLAAAGCVLPLTQNRNISSDLGTRHRAAIGISEVADAVVVVVSEETGTISVAVNGMLKRHLAPQTLSKLLKNELDPQTDEEQQGLFGKVKKKFEKKDKQETDRPKEKKKLFRKKAKDDNDAKQ